MKSKVNEVCLGAGYVCIPTQGCFSALCPSFKNPSLYSGRTGHGIEGFHVIISLSLGVLEKITVAVQHVTSLTVSQFFHWLDISDSSRFLQP